MFHTGVNNTNVLRSSYKVPDIVFRFEINMEFFDRLQNPAYVKFHENQSSGSSNDTHAAVRADIRTGRYDKVTRRFPLFMLTCLTSSTLATLAPT
jgi:hypothetical protein